MHCVAEYPAKPGISSSANRLLKRRYRTSKSAIRPRSPSNLDAVHGRQRAEILEKHVGSRPQVSHK